MVDVLSAPGARGGVIRIVVTAERDIETFLRCRHGITELTRFKKTLEFRRNNRAVEVTGTNYWYTGVFQLQLFDITIHQYGICQPGVLL